MGAQSIGLSHPVDPDHESKSAGPPRFHPGQCVFEHRRPSGLHAKSTGSGKESVRGGLSRQVVRLDSHAVDPDRE
jgi:hypothetical protein